MALGLLGSLLLANPTANNMEMLSNAYADYSATVKGVNKWGPDVEINPIANRLFHAVKHVPKGLDLLGAAYFPLLALTSRINGPIGGILTEAARLGHFLGAYTWRDSNWQGSGFLDRPIQYTIYRKEF